MEWGLLKNNRLAIQPEILFVQKGGKTEFTDFGPMLTNDEVYRINYLEIPVLLNALPGAGREHQPRAREPRQRVRRGH